MCFPVVGAALLVLVWQPTVADAWPPGVSFRAPHVVRPTHAVLAPPLMAELRESLAAVTLPSPQAAIDWSVGFVTSHLSFGLGHRSSMRFAEPRRGNCVEYANLLAEVIHVVSREKGLSLSAFVVRSDARVLGQRLPHRFLRDHDWTLVVDREGGARFAVDASLAEIGADWSINDNVDGRVSLPRGVGKQPRFAPTAPVSRP